MILPKSMPCPFQDRAQYRAEASIEYRMVCPSGDRPHPPSSIDALEISDSFPASTPKACHPKLSSSRSPWLNCCQIVHEALGNKFCRTCFRMTRRFPYFVFQDDESLSDWVRSALAVEFNGTRDRHHDQSPALSLVCSCIGPRDLSSSTSACAGWTSTGRGKPAFICENRIYDERPSSCIWGSALRSLSAGQESRALRTTPAWTRFDL